MKKPHVKKTRHVHREIRGPFDAAAALDREWLVTNGRGGYASASISQALTRRYHGLLVAAVEPPVKRSLLLAKLDLTALVGHESYELGTNAYRDVVHPAGHTLLTSFIAGPQPRWRWRAGGAVIEQSLAMIEGEDAVVVRYRLIEGDKATLTIRPMVTDRHFHHLTNAESQGNPTLNAEPGCVSIHWPDAATTLYLRHAGQFEKAGDWYYGFRLPVESDRGFDCEQDLFTPGTIQVELSAELKTTYIGASTRLIGNAAAMWEKATGMHATPRRKKRRRSKKHGTQPADAGTLGGKHPVAHDEKHPVAPDGKRTVARADESVAQGGKHPGAHIGASTTMGDLGTNDKAEQVSRRTPVERGPSTGAADSANEPSDASYSAFAEGLRESARQFIVNREEDLRTIIAGYPWFGDWGRDTFIALPGLCLSTGRYGDARRIIRMFANHVDGGMIPNRFPPYGEPPQYNTCDATLWYVHAMDAYVRHTKDWALVSETLYPIVCEIIERHVAGTRHGIRVDRDGLLAAGEPGVALTWMDAKIDDRTITPRIGKPVEINALWYNAISIAADFAVHARDGLRAKAWCDLAQQCRVSFNERFWNGNAGCLFDIVDVNHVKGTTDDRIRPNQLLAISLPHDILDASRWRSVVDVCERELLTPMGMRTLSPRHADYRSHYAGDPVARDEAYHQGTVWPWLIGPFVSAYVKTHGKDAIPTARHFLNRLMSHFDEAGLGGVSEIADGDAPHRPNGCPWQAWSVAEPLRVLVDELDVPLATQFQD